EREQILALETRRARRAPVRREQPQEREHALAFARARLADDAERLARLELEAQLAHGVDLAVRRREAHVEIFDFEQHGRWYVLLSSAAPSAVFRVERVAQAVADEVEREQRHGEEHGREDQHPRRALELLRARAHERAPRRHRLLHAEPEEAQEGLDED